MEAAKDAHNRRIDANAAILQALIRRQPEIAAYEQQRHAVTVVQKNARAFSAQRSYVKVRDDARRKAQLENRLEEAKMLAESKDAELEALRAELAKEQQLRKTAETNAATLQREVEVLKLSVNKATGADSAAGARVAALEKEVERLQCSAVEAAQAEEVISGLSSEIDALKAELASTKERHAEELQWVAARSLLPRD